MNTSPKMLTPILTLRSPAPLNHLETPRSKSLHHWAAFLYDFPASTSPDSSTAVSLAFSSPEATLDVSMPDLKSTPRLKCFQIKTYQIQLEDTKQMKVHELHEFCFKLFFFHEKVNPYCTRRVAISVSSQPPDALHLQPDSARAMSAASTTRRCLC